MKRHHVKWADIPIIIRVSDEKLTRSLNTDFIPLACDNTTPIEIDVDENSLTEEDFDFARLPEVKLYDDHLIEVKHPDYKGQYALHRQKGNVWVNGPNALMAFLRTIFYFIIVEKDGLAIHSSCIKKQGQAYIFSGPSGSGKSTIISLTKKPDVYSDEVTLLRKDKDGRLIVHYSPFRSEYFTSYNPPITDIAGLFLLEQSTEVQVKPVSTTAALLELMANIFLPVSQENPLTKKIFNLCCDLLEQIPVAELQFRKDSTFWRKINDKYQ